MAEAHCRELPPDVVFSQILPLLQVKSLLRFKCVSKEWHSFLTTPAFAKMQFQHHVDVLTPKLVALSETAPYNFFCLSTDCQRPFPFPFNPALKRQPSIRFLTSAHGLICVGIAKQGGPDMIRKWIEYSNLILWNPATNDRKTLSRPPTSLKDCYRIIESQFGLCHSSFDDDYKLVSVTHRPNVYIYSLKSDSWRKVESDYNQYVKRPSYVLLSHNRNWTVSFNGTIYFLEVYDLRHSFQNDMLNNTKTFPIVMFNTKTDTLKKIETPAFGNQDETPTCLNFKVEKDECIHIWVNIRSVVYMPSNSRNELWRMDREGCWTKLVESRMTRYGYISSHMPLYFIKNGILLVYDWDGGCVYQLNMKTNARGSGSYIIKSMYVKHVGSEYIETMVSPNQYIN